MTAKPTTAAPEQIPTPRPTPAQSPAGQPTVAAATPAVAESVAFTADWYAKYPEAWRPAKSPADWWKNADVATITAWLGPQWLRWILAGSFIAMAAWMLVPDRLDDDDAPDAPRHSVLVTTVIAFFLAEMGDKTQVATVMLESGVLSASV